jgi:hypothetical protein
MLMPQVPANWRGTSAGHAANVGRLTAEWKTAADEKRAGTENGIPLKRRCWRPCQHAGDSDRIGESNTGYTKQKAVAS